MYRKLSILVSVLFAPSMAAANGITKCPSGASLAGDAPPRGDKQWCEAKDLFGRVVENGPMLIWHQNGRLAERRLYVDGRPHGDWTTWDERGDLLAKKTYSHGDLIVSQGVRPKELKPPTLVPIGPKNVVSAPSATWEQAYRRQWDPATMAVQYGLGLAGLFGGGFSMGFLGIVAATGCDTAQCTGAVTSGFVLAGATVGNSLGVYLGGELMSSRGNYWWTFFGTLTGFGLSSVGGLTNSAGLRASLFFLAMTVPVLFYHASYDDGYDEMHEFVDNSLFNFNAGKGFSVGAPSLAFGTNDSNEDVFMLNVLGGRF